ncbi:MAG: hypothetical protein IT203_12255 [Fimbriimonadaceae bacterium]|nr:hypothetical protein [Fimbriimonadaceae bacterium]
MSKRLPYLLIYIALEFAVVVCLLLYLLKERRDLVPVAIALQVVAAALGLWMSRLPKR